MDRQWRRRMGADQMEKRKRKEKSCTQDREMGPRLLDGSDDHLINGRVMVFICRDNDK